MNRKEDFEKERRRIVEREQTLFVLKEVTRPETKTVIDRDYAQENKPAKFER